MLINISVGTDSDEKFMTLILIFLNYYCVHAKHDSFFVTRIVSLRILLQRLEISLESRNITFREQLRCLHFGIDVLPHTYYYAYRHLEDE